MMKFSIALALLGLSLSVYAPAQNKTWTGVKTNAVYDATTTVNLGLEVGLSQRWSLDLSGNYNGWEALDGSARVAFLGLRPLRRPFRGYACHRRAV